MADANPSGPRVTSQGASTKHIQVPKTVGIDVGRNKQGRLVSRKSLAGGDRIETFMHEGEATEETPFLDKVKVANDPRPVTQQGKKAKPVKAKKGE